jgi:hypothetical protein
MLYTRRTRRVRVKCVGKKVMPDITTLLAAYVFHWLEIALHAILPDN